MGTSVVDVVVEVVVDVEEVEGVDVEGVDVEDVVASVGTGALDVEVVPPSPAVTAAEGEFSG